MIHRLHKMGRDRTAKTFCGKLARWLEGKKAIRKYRTGVCGRPGVLRAVLLDCKVPATCRACLQVTR